MSFEFRLSRTLRIERRLLGSEQEPLLIVDDLLEAPKRLVDYACTQVAFRPAWRVDGGFPGLRAAAPLNYVKAVVTALGPVVRQAFALGDAQPAGAECNLSLVTLPPKRLTAEQRIPHIDTTDPLQFAFLHYLCETRYGGTAFYRHRATGFEAVTPGRSARYEQTVAEELAQQPPAVGYVGEDDSRYWEIGRVEAQFNRLVIYRSRLLHSGRPDPALLSADPASGRLTANIFVHFARPRC
ncbi:MAG: DUF6445 family protein [Allosphingosinicella sp.]|uniref:DUF6445 family protein n=1 Tax=Allosphingosinicella sp. TaxID=2823234 RepID=UPI00395CE713